MYSKSNATATIAAPTFIWDIGLLKTLFRSVYDQKKLWRRLFTSDQLIGARRACTQPSYATPPWHHYDRCQKFHRRAATARKSFDEIKETAYLTFGDKSFHKFTIYHIINKVKASKIMDDRCHLKAKKTKRSPMLVSAVTATVEKLPGWLYRTLSRPFRSWLTWFLPSFTKNWA